MNYLLYGEDVYRSAKKLDSIKTKYINSGMGDINLANFEAPNFSYDDLARQVNATPFLVAKRLIVIRNFLKLGKRDLQSKVADCLKKIPSSAVVIFYEEGVPDKRLALFKKLNKPRQSEEFKSLAGAQLKKWTQEEIEKRGGKINSEALEELIERASSDLWRMSNEIDKLIAYDKNITLNHIRLLVAPRFEAKIFDLIDAISGRDENSAMKILRNFYRSGENPFYLFSMIIGQFRNMLIVKDYLESLNNKSSNNYSVSKALSIHPFVAQKIISCKDKFSIALLKNIYKSFLDFDTKIKTGKMEIETALELLIIDLGRRG